MIHHASNFVADGFIRLQGSTEFRQRKKALEARLRAKYAAELESASGYWERRAIERIIREEMERSQPSLYCLW